MMLAMRKKPERENRVPISARIRQELLDQLKAEAKALDVEIGTHVRTILERWAHASAGASAAAWPGNVARPGRGTPLMAAAKEPHQYTAGRRRR